MSIVRYPRSSWAGSVYNIYKKLFLFELLYEASPPISGHEGFSTVIWLRRWKEYSSPRMNLWRTVISIIIFYCLDLSVYWIIVTSLVKHLRCHNLLKVTCEYFEKTPQCQRAAKFKQKSCRLERRKPIYRARYFEQGGNR